MRRWKIVPSLLQAGGQEAHITVHQEAHINVRGGRFDGVYDG